MSANDLPDGTDWGENTKQAHEDFPLSSDDKIPNGFWNKHTDADEIRRKFSIPKFDLRDYESYEQPYANALVHTTDGKYFGHVGGTNLLAVGEKGSGKSTLGLHAAVRLLDDKVGIPDWAHPDCDADSDTDTNTDAADDADGGNEDDDKSGKIVEKSPDAVVWRGQPAASEWLPYKKWTTLWLPENADVQATWETNDMRNRQSEEADLTEVVREVKRYESPVDLNRRMDAGTFNVVYPDPSFTNCEDIMGDSDYCAEPVTFTPAWEAGDGDDATPLVHWWFAYLTAKLEYGPYDWTTLIFDEAADLAPQGAKADKNQTHAKVKALRKVMAHSRKHYLSIMFFAHHEQNLHHKIRRTLQWRVDMPDGTANPCDQNNDNPPVGFSQIPMIADMMSDKPVGYGLWWNETNFTRFRWSDIPGWEEDESRWLKIGLDKPSAQGTTASSGQGSTARTAANAN